MPDAEPARRNTILVADDEDIVRVLAALSLERAGYAVLLAADGEQATALFRRHNAEIAAVILDGHAGYERREGTARLIREIDPGMPVIASIGLARRRRSDALERA